MKAGNVIKMASLALIAAVCLMTVPQQVMAQAEPITFSFNMAFGAPGSPEEQSVDDLLSELDRLAKGRFKCDRIANGIMGGEREVAEAIQMGTLDCTIVSDVGIDVVTGNLGWAWLPFMITSYEEADKYYHQGWIYDDMTKKMEEAGIVRLASAETGSTLQKLMRCAWVSATGAGSAGGSKSLPFFIHARLNRSEVEGTSPPASRTCAI